MIKNRFFKKFKFSFILSLSLFILLTMVLIFTVENSIISSIIRNEIKKTMASPLYLLERDIKSKVSDLSLRASFLCKNKELFQILESKDVAAILNVISDYQNFFYANIFVDVYDNSGALIAQSGNSLFSEKLNSSVIGKALKTDLLIIEFFKHDKRLFIKCTGSVFSYESYVGVVVLYTEISPSYLLDVKNSTGFDLSIFSNEKNIIISTFPDEALSLPNHMENSILSFIDDKKTISASKYLDDFNIGLAAYFPLSELTAKEKNAKAKILFFSLLILFYALFFLDIFSSKIVNPINLLIKGIEKVAKGDFSHHIDYVSENELGSAIDSFNAMTKQLKENKAKEVRFAELDKIASIGRLAASVAHEVKNPLMSVSVIINMYRDEFDTIDFQREDFNVISSEINRINTIIEKLLDFSRNAKTNISDIDLVKLVTEMKTLVQKRAKESGSSIEITTPTSAIVRGDASLLKQAILNIMINSIEATQNGKIKIIIEQTPSSLTIKFSDTGRGMTEDEIKKASEPFYTTKLTGTGIGLAVVKKIMNMHDFDWKIESEKNLGTTISIFIDIEKNRNLSIEELNYDEEITERKTK